MKIIDLTMNLKDFEGNEIQTSEKDKTPVNLKRILLQYCRMTDQMDGLSDADQLTLYEVGMLVGTQNILHLSQAQYDVLKKMCDCGTISNQGKKVSIFHPEIRFQVKALVDAAVEAKEE